MADSKDHIVPPAPTDSLRHAMAQASVAVFVIDQEGIVREAEGALLPQLLDRPAAATGQALRDLFPDIAHLPLHMDRVFEGESVGDVIAYGEATWSVRHSPMRAADGSIEACISLWHDITARANTEAVQRAREERYRFLSEAAFEGIILHDNGVAIDANPALAAMFGYEISELLGRPVMDFVDAAYHDTIRKFVKEGSEQAYQAVAIHRDGRRFPVEVRGRLATYQGRRVRVASIRDITERKKTEAALAESDYRYREIFENATDILYTHDLQGNITSVNKATEREIGYTRDEALTMNIRDIIAPEYMELAHQMTAGKLTGTGQAMFEVEVLTRDQRRLVLEINTRTIFEDGRPIGVQGVGRNTTQRKRMERELQYRLHFEELITSISTHFINLEPKEIDAGIEQALASIGRFAKVDTAFIFQWSGDGKYATNTHEWCADGIPSMAESFPRFPIESAPWLMAQLDQFDPVVISSLEELPAAAAEEKKWAAIKGLQSFAMVPLVYQGASIGIVGYACVESARHWGEDDIAIMKIVGEIFVNALERKRAEEALRESEDRYKLAAQGANDGLWDWDLDSDECYYSPRWKASLDLTDEDVVGTSEAWFHRIHPDDQPVVSAAVQAHIEGQTPHFETEYRMQRKDGKYLWMLCRGMAVRDGKGRAYRMAGSQTDITERKAAEEQLLHDAFHDSLTGLPNRALFLDRLERSIHRARRHNDYDFAVLFIDVNRFKLVNDSLGHAIGDELLVAIPARLQACLRPGDTLARLGGDEFTVLLEDLPDPEEATRVAGHIHDALARPFTVGGHEIFSSASIGIAYNTSEYEHPEDLLRDADTAMYRAKLKQGARYVMFDTHMHVRAIERLQLETDLRKALENEAFHVHYQPIISLETGQIAGFEALLRWQHPERGLVPTADFIPVIEETGLILGIGHWILDKACRQLKDWQQRSGMPLSMSVNLSAKQFSQPDLVTSIADVLRTTGIARGSLKLELTETVLMANEDFLSEMLKELKALDVQLQIDDFGTGYSSLSYLHRFPIDGLKVDRAFVNGLSSESAHNTEIVRTIISLAQNLNMPVIAEGVETVEQLEILRSLDCDYAQGFYFSVPLDAVAAGELIAEAPQWKQTS